MAKKMLAAVIVLSLFVLASFSNAANLSNNESNTVLLNITGNTTNSTNSTLNSTDSLLNSTIANLTKKSDLWSWGEVPAGYTRAANNSIVPEAYLDAEGSVMETPSQAVSNNNVASDRAGLLVRPT